VLQFEQCAQLNSSQVQSPNGIGKVVSYPWITSIAKLKEFLNDFSQRLSFELLLFFSRFDIEQTTHVAVLNIFGR
jgi:hypothetical protein